MWEGKGCGDDELDSWAMNRDGAQDEDEERRNGRWRDGERVKDGLESREGVLGQT